MNISKYAANDAARISEPAKAKSIMAGFQLSGKVRLLLAIVAVALLAGCAQSGCTRVGTPQGWSAGAVDDGVLYIGTMQGEILAVTKEKGDLEWRRALPADEDVTQAIYGRPAVTDDAVLVGGYNGVLYAYDRAGDLEWQEPLSGRIVGGPSVHENVALVGTGAVSTSDGGDGALYAIDIQSGDPIWEYLEIGPVWSSPTVADGRVYVGSLDHNVYAVDLESGAEVWRYTSGGAVVSSIVVRDGLAIFGGFDSRLYALDIQTGMPVWVFNGSTRWYWSKPLVHDGLVYAPSLDGTLYALDSKTGELVWSFPTEGQIVGSPAIVSSALSDLVAVPVADGGDSRIALLETNGSQLYACAIDDDIRTSIEVDGDLIYFGSKNSTIWALRIKSQGNPDEEWVFVTDADDPHPPDRMKAC